MMFSRLSLNLSVLLPRPCARLQSLPVRRYCAWLYQIDNILVERIAGPSPFGDRPAIVRDRMFKTFFFIPAVPCARMLIYSVFTNVLYAALLVRKAFWAQPIDRYPLISLSVLPLLAFTFLPRPRSMQPTA